MSDTIKITYRGETITLTCNLVEASAPLVIDGEHTCLQTADASHRTDHAALLACRWTWPGIDWPSVPSSGYADIEDNEEWDEVAYEEVG